MRLLRAGKRNYGADERVDLLDPLSIRHFTRALGSTERELIEAVARAGPEKSKLRLLFRRRPMTRRRAA